VSAEIIELDVVTSLDIPVERVLRKAREAGLESVVVIGWDEDGDLYFASSLASGPEVVWLLEKTKANLLVAGETS
jgi:hypothetical protein